MVLVRGHDAFTALEIAEQTVDWDTAGTTFYRVPLLSETLTYVRDLYPKSREFGATGAIDFIEPGRAVARGSITVHPRYNARWFHILMAHAFGSETVIPDEWVDGGASGTVGNTHGYTFAAALPNGLTLRVHKSGPSDSGYVDDFIGGLVSRVTWEQPEDDIARVTFDFVAKSVTTALASGIADPGATAGTVYLKPRDLSNTGAMFETGASYGWAQNIRSFRLIWDRNIDFEPNFLQDPDTPVKPGVTDTRDVTIEIGSLLEQNYGAANSPWTEFLAKTESRLNIIYTSTSLVQGSDPYAIRFNMPKMIWEAVENPVSAPAENPFTMRGRGVDGAVLNSAGYDENTVDATGDPADLRCFIAVKNTDEPSVDAAFSTL